MKRRYFTAVFAILVALSFTSIASADVSGQEQIREGVAQMVAAPGIALDGLLSGSDLFNLPGRLSCALTEGIVDRASGAVMGVYAGAGSFISGAFDVFDGALSLTLDLSPTS